MLPFWRRRRSAVDEGCTGREKGLALQQFGPDAQRCVSPCERAGRGSGGGRRRRAGDSAPDAAPSLADVLRTPRAHPFLAAAGFLALAIVVGYAALTRPPHPITQDDIDAAVLHTLETVPQLSHAAKAYEAVRRPSCAHGTGFAKEQGACGRRHRQRRRHRRPGIILTNMHVVAGADRILVSSRTGSRPKRRDRRAAEHDLAVLKAARP